MAEGEVSIQKGQVEGKGKQARYYVTNNSIILVGNPVVIDKIRGETRGDKLTFFLADDRILVENQERERSVTEIKW